jgi:hypothetical protein
LFWFHWELSKIALFDPIEKQAAAKSGHCSTLAPIRMSTASFDNPHPKRDLSKVIYDKGPAKCDAFMKWCARPQIKARAPYTHNDFLNFGFSLIEEGYVSAPAYASHAQRWMAAQRGKLDKEAGDWQWLMDEVRKGLNHHVTTEVEQAIPIVIGDLARAPPKQRNDLLFALASGTRPVALASVDNYQKRRDDKGILRQYHLFPRRDKVELSGRVCRVFCTCPYGEEPATLGASMSFCPIHSVPFPDLPIATGTLRRYLKGCDYAGIYTLYSLRRKHCCAVVRIAAEDYKISLKRMLATLTMLSRINAQLGWCEDSRMFARYCKNPPVLTALDREFFGPITAFYITGKDRAPKK